MFQIHRPPSLLPPKLILIIIIMITPLLHYLYNIATFMRDIEVASNTYPDLPPIMIVTHDGVLQLIVI